MGVTELVERNCIFNVQADAENGCGSAVLVVAGVVDKLVIKSGCDAAIKMDVVVGLDDLFESVIQMAIAENKAKAAQRKVFSVVAGQGIPKKGSA